ncbi:MAG: hypothetical protein R2788_14795 [Saprospiraceae bacterium]
MQNGCLSERETAIKYIWIFVPLVIIIITAVSNGANLMDGLDGLATGVSGSGRLAIFATYQVT